MDQKLCIARLFKRSLKAKRRCSSALAEKRKYNTFISFQLSSFKNIFRLHLKGAMDLVKYTAKSGPTAFYKVNMDGQSSGSRISGVGSGSDLQISPTIKKT